MAKIRSFLLMIRDGLESQKKDLGSSLVITSTQGVIAWAVAKIAWIMLRWILNYESLSILTVKTILYDDSLFNSTLRVQKCATQSLHPIASSAFYLLLAALASSNRSKLDQFGCFAKFPRIAPNPVQSVVILERGRKDSRRSQNEWLLFRVQLFAIPSRLRRKFLRGLLVRHRGAEGARLLAAPYRGRLRMVAARKGDSGLILSWNAIFSVSQNRSPISGKWRPILGNRGQILRIEGSPVWRQTL